MVQRTRHRNELPFSKQQIVLRKLLHITRLLSSFPKADLAATTVLVHVKKRYQLPSSDTLLLKEAGDPFKTVHGTGNTMEISFLLREKASTFD